MEFATKQSVTQLIQATWSLISSLSLSDSEANSLQDQFDAILATVNQKTQNVSAPAQLDTVDHERKQRREKDKKPKKEKKDASTSTEPTEAPVAAPEPETQKVFKAMRKPRATKVKTDGTGE